MNNVFGSALTDFFQKQMREPLFLYTNGDPMPEIMPITVFFRTEKELDILEKKAIQHCKGHVLDIGAGAGAISKILLNKGFDTTSLEINEDACSIMKSLGIKKVIQNDILNLKNQTFDTLLLLMNGIGLCKDMKGLQLLLTHLKTLLKPDGQIIFDSSDISYLYEESLFPYKNYFGEVQFQYEYKKRKSDFFKWLYVDQKSLQDIAKNIGFTTELLFENKNDQYLMKLKVNG